jgi:hypothetical protein
MLYYSVLLSYTLVKLMGQGGGGGCPDFHLSNQFKQIRNVRVWI